MQRTTAAKLAFAVAGLATSLAVLPASAADQPTCGLNNGKAATGEPIQLGAVVGKTGPADFSSPAQAADAYFKCVNKNGGINGRPIAYSIEDDAWKPEQAAQVAVKLVKDKKVVAMVGNSSFVECAVNEHLYETEGVLVVAGVGVPRDCFHVKNIAPTNEGPRLSNLGAVMYMVKTFGIKNIVCISPNIPGVGDFSCDGIKAWVADKGIQYHNILIDPATPDATSIVLQAVSLKPDLIEVSLPREGATPIFAAAEQQDLADKIHFSAPTSVYNELFPKAIGPYWSGKAFVELELEPLDKNAPDSKNWHAILDTYGKSSDQRDTFSQAGYVAARVIVNVLLKMDPKTIDRASVSQALKTMKGFRSDIMCGPWYFGEGDEHNANHAGSVAVIENGKFVTKAACFQIDDPDLVNIRKMEAATHIAD
jgi:branched-chain amino acid transport system substrate-binding protein